MARDAPSSAGPFGLRTKGLRHSLGSDGSRGFTDALTEILENVIRQRSEMDSVEAEWEVVRQKIRKERKAKNENNGLGDIDSLNEGELRELIQQMSPQLVQQAMKAISPGA